MTSFAAFAVFLIAAGSEAGSPLAEVNGRTLTDRDLDAYLAVRGVTASAPALRKRAAVELIDRELIRDFLARNKVTPDPAQLDLEVRRAKERLAAGDTNPEESLAALGIDEDRIRSEIALTLAWRKLAARSLAEAQIREYFERHRRRLDGTRLRVAQIFLKYEPAESAASAPKTSARLGAIRERIVSGDVTFEAASKMHSQSPTAENGEVGWIGPEGDLPRPVSAAAYDLKEGELSGVIPSRLGMHLVVVLEAESGDLSLEDVRPEIIEELSRNLWEETVAAQRQTAKILLHGDHGEGPQ